MTCTSTEKNEALDSKHIVADFNNKFKNYESQVLPLNPNLSLYAQSP